MRQRRESWTGLVALLAAALVAVAAVGGDGYVPAALALLVTLLVTPRRPALIAPAIAATLLWSSGRLLPPVAAWAAALGAVGLLLAVVVGALVGPPSVAGNRAFRRLAALTALAGYGAALGVFARWWLGEPWLLVVEPLAVGGLGALLFVLIRRALVRQHRAIRALTLAATLTYVPYVALEFLPGTPPGTPLLALAILEWGLLAALVLALATIPDRGPAPVVAQPRAPLPAWRVALGDLMVLMKMRVASLLLLTTLGGMIVAARGWPGWGLVGWVMLGGLLSVGGAGALNHYLDRDIDGHMGRTSRRPIPSGRIAAGRVLALGFGLSVAQLAIFWLAVNPLAAALSTAGLLYYIVIYTIWLKRSSTQNIVIGGAAGAFPPLVGWAAVTGELTLGALFLFAIIFFWTPPHFWALALMRKDDYARAGIPMLPVVRGDRETRGQIVAYTVVTVALTLAAVPLGLMGWPYLVAAIALGGKFLWDALRLYRRPGNRAALTLYRYSLLYLALLFVAMAADRALPL